MGEFDFAALHDTAYSEESLKNPYNEGVTIDHKFLAIPHLENIITDTQPKAKFILYFSLSHPMRDWMDERKVTGSWDLAPVFA